MSRARRLKKLAPQRDDGALSPRLSRLRKRRRVACRAQHWRRLLASAKLEPWRRPVDQNCRVAYVIGRCSECRTNALACAAVTDQEADERRGPHELTELLMERLATAYETFRFLVTPRSRR
jgi:hypothetical protein